MKALICFFIFAMTSASGFAADFKTCVLVFDQPTSRISEATTRLYHGSPVQVLVGAQPLDLVNCINQGANEIVIIAHAFKDPRSNELAQLGYFNEKQPKVFFDRVFTRANEAYQERMAQGLTKPLVSVRLMVCESDEILKRYGEFRRFIKQNNIKLDVLPRSTPLSILSGKDVTRFNSLWLRKSLWRYPGF